MSPYRDAAREATDIHYAQIQKMDSLLSLLDVSPDDRILEVGCGWGGLAIRAAQRFGCLWVGIALSAEQLAEATERVREAKLESKVTLLLMDHRQLRVVFAPNSFDKMVCVETLEHVGHADLGTFLNQLSRALKTNGTFVVQTILVPDQHYAARTARADFVTKHVFPGAHYVCGSELARLAVQAGLEHDEAVTRSLGLSYAKTLQVWRARFAAAAASGELLELSIKDHFGTAERVAALARKFDYFFALAQAGFAARHVDAQQLRFRKTSEPPPDTAIVAVRRAKSTSLLSAVMHLIVLVQIGLGLVAALVLALKPLAAPALKLLKGTAKGSAPTRG
jgi:cyclopropane-fatty-acyl-phospholipid synthase